MLKEGKKHVFEQKELQFNSEDRVLKDQMQLERYESHYDRGPGSPEQELSGRQREQVRGN